MKAATLTCQNCKKDFILEPDDFTFYEKIKVPPPTFCPECRNIQRMATRNVKSLYKRSCDSCNNMTISRISQFNPGKMYCQKCWWSDEWDATSYGRDYDFSKTFFEQFHTLLISVPQPSTFNLNMINSDYSNMESDDKECYLTFGGHYNEYCAFTEYCMRGKEVYDSYWAFSSEQCYECINIEHCYRVEYSRECRDCMNIYFSYDCRNCNEVIGCAGLRHKSYCIFNKQYTKEEYFKEKEKINLGSRTVVDEMIKKSYEIWLQTPHLFMNASQVINCTGNDVFNSKNAQNVWQADGIEDSKNLYIAAWSKDTHDETSAAGNELGYMNTSGGGLYNCKAVLYSFQADFKEKKHTFNSEYSYTILGCSDCFGCVGLRKKKYCILNKQYSKEEYEELVGKIRQHMDEMPFISPISGLTFKYGDFFPNEHTMFAYNETIANDFYPIKQEEAKGKGFVWREDPASEYNFTNYTIPDNIKNVDDSILQAVLKCEQSGKAYKITSQELEFYRKINIPIPTISPLQRIKNRVSELLPFKLHDRSCMCQESSHGHTRKCDNEFKTAYSPQRPEIVYCESCYQQEIS